MARNIRLSSTSTGSSGTSSYTTLSATNLCATNLCFESAYNTSGCKVKEWVEIACCTGWTNSQNAQNTLFCLPFCDFSEICFYLAMPGCTSCCTSNASMRLVNACGVCVDNVPNYIYYTYSGGYCVFCCCFIMGCYTYCNSNVWSGTFKPHGAGIEFCITEGTPYTGSYGYVTWSFAKGIFNGQSCDLKWCTFSGFNISNPTYAGNIYPENGAVQNLQYKIYGIPC